MLRMKLKSKNLNKVRALLYTILKYFFKKYFGFGSVSLFWIWEKNICAWVDSIKLGINGQYIPTFVSGDKIWLTPLVY